MYIPIKDLLVKDASEKKPKPELRQITIYGLLSYYGTHRAIKCAELLNSRMPKLYAVPSINVYYDHEWAGIVRELRENYGSKYKKLWHFKNPLVIFFNDKYVGDHRAIIHYTIMEHRILPELPFPNLFPDFTKLLPKRHNKDYIYLDVRVGDLDDYVVGKMVFELHSDRVPRTCEFFKNFCTKYQEPSYGTTKKQRKPSYLGSIFNRIYGNSFVQGGKIEEYEYCMPNENYDVKHDKRGIISLCDNGCNNSSSEFCISFKENKWLDGKVVAFGYLIFGEPILTAVQEVPTYYQSPLKEIIIVGCGVIPNYETTKESDFVSKIEYQKELINIDIELLRKKRMEEAIDFEEKLNSYLKKSELGKGIQYVYTEELESSSAEEFYKTMEEQVEELYISVEEEAEDIALSKERLHITKRSSEGTLGEELEEEFEEQEPSFLGPNVETFEKEGKTFKLYTDFTAQQLINLKRRSEKRKKISMIQHFLLKVIDNMEFDDVSEDLDYLDHVEKKVIQNKVDPHDVPSDELLEKRFKAGLYSLPSSLKEALVKTYDELTPSQLKLLGMEAKEIMKEGGASDKSLSVLSSEDIVSGMAMMIFQYKKPKPPKGKEIEDFMKDILDEASQDTIMTVEAIGGSELARQLHAGIEESGLEEAGTEDLKIFSNIEKAFTYASDISNLSSTSRLEEEPTFASKLEEEPTLASKLEEEPTLASKLEEEPTLASKLEEEPTLASKLEEEPTSASKLEEEGSEEQSALTSHLEEELGKGDN